VFGSLDRERRAHVLELLGTLAGTTDAFRQSAIFNQVWRRSESEEGVSQVEDVTDAGGVDEL
jgi:hypothetical protein